MLQHDMTTTLLASFQVEGPFRPFDVGRPMPMERAGAPRAAAAKDASRLRSLHAVAGWQMGYWTVSRQPRVRARGASRRCTSHAQHTQPWQPQFPTSAHLLLRRPLCDHVHALTFRFHDTSRGHTATCGCAKCELLWICACRCPPNSWKAATRLCGRLAVPRFCSSLPRCRRAHLCRAVNCC